MEYSPNRILDNKDPKISAVSGKIHIDNNWTDAKVAGICTGGGTYSEPYIIENLEIDGENSGSCILIEYSNEFFRIEDCTLYNSGGYPAAGILLNYTDNGFLIHNECSSNFFGINILNSDNNTLSGNSADNNGIGILFNRGYNNTVSGNIASYNNATGIYLWSGTYTNITGNIVSYNNQNGIMLWTFDCYDNIITKNIIKENSWYGVSIGNGDDNNIYLNCFTENGWFNAYDSGSNNHWDNGTIGNYWSNYTGLDADDDGIGDVPYNITGSAENQDNFPLMKCPILTPQDGGGIPIGLIILISVISGGAVIGVATILLLRRKRKRIE